MCSSPKIPPPAKPPEPIAMPKQADASVQKAGADARKKTTSLARNDIKTSSRGLGLGELNLEKKKYLGQ